MRLVGYEGQQQRIKRIPELLDSISKNIDVVCIQEAWCPDKSIICGDDKSRDILTGGMKKYGWKDLFTDTAIIAVIGGAMLLIVGSFSEFFGKFLPF